MWGLHRGQGSEGPGGDPVNTRTGMEKHRDVKLAIETMNLLIGCLEDHSISSVERVDGMTTVILALILKVRSENKGE